MPITNPFLTSMNNLWITSTTSEARLSLNHEPSLILVNIPFRTEQANPKFWIIDSQLHFSIYLSVDHRQWKTTAMQLLNNLFLVSSEAIPWHPLSTICRPARPVDRCCCWAECWASISIWRRWMCWKASSWNRSLYKSIRSTRYRRWWTMGWCCGKGEWQ